MFAGDILHRGNLQLLRLEPEMLGAELFFFMHLLPCSEIQSSCGQMFVEADGCEVLYFSF